MYNTVQELIQTENENVDFKIIKVNSDSSVLISSIHGGDIEPGTSELSDSIQGRGNYNFYSFKGIKQGDNSELSIDSTSFEEQRLTELIRESDYSVFLYLTDDDSSSCYLSGLDSGLRNLLWSRLEEKGYTVDTPANKYIYDKDTNIVNKNRRGKGVQIQISKSLMATFFKNGDLSKSNRENKSNWTSEMVKFSTCIYQSIEEYLSYQTQGTSIKYNILL